MHCLQKVPDAVHSIHLIRPQTRPLSRVSRTLRPRKLKRFQHVPVAQALILRQQHQRILLRS